MGQTYKYLGAPGLALLALGTGALMVVLPRLVTQLQSLLTERQALWLAALTVLLLVAVFFALYPLAHSGRIGGGSDADDALNLASKQLLHGRYPYYPRTYLGNPIGPLPGSVLLATPFVLLGNSAYQNLFWIPVFFLAMRSQLRSTCHALALLWVLLILCPGVWQQLVVGGDLLSNGIFVTLFTLGVVVWVPDPHANTSLKIGLLIALGVGISSRLNYVLILPLVFASLARHVGWKAAIRNCLIVCIAFGMVTLPFYLYDPSGFTPLSDQFHKVSRFSSVLPFAGIVVPVLGAAVALGLSWRSTNGCIPGLCAHSAIVQATPVLAGIVLSGLVSGSFDGAYALYGLSFTFFGVASWWPCVAGRTVIGSFEVPSLRAVLRR